MAAVADIDDSIKRTRIRVSLKNHFQFLPKLVTADDTSSEFRRKTVPNCRSSNAETPVSELCSGANEVLRMLGYPMNEDCGLVK